MKPGIQGTTFKIGFSEHHFIRNDIFTNNTIQVKVIKVYKFTWWKQLLLWLGIKTDWVLFTGVKVKQV